jgi:hypothetical protein
LVDLSRIEVVTSLVGAQRDQAVPGRRDPLVVGDDHQGQTLGVQVLAIRLLSAAAGPGRVRRSPFPKTGDI